MKLIPYQRPCNIESIAFLCILVKFNVGNENCISQFQALLTHPPRNTGVKFKQVTRICQILKIYARVA